MVTILVLAHDEKDMTIQCISSIRTFVEKKELSVILVDNGSTDGLKEWAQEQQDISYVYFDDGLEPWGSVIRKTIDAFEIDTDIVVMQSRVILLPGSITCMELQLNADSNTAMVGCVTTNAKSIHQIPDRKVSDVPEAIGYFKDHLDEKPCRVIGVEPGIFMLKKGCFDCFDPQIWSLSALVKDMALKFNEAKMDIYACRNCIVYEMSEILPENKDCFLRNDEDLELLEKKWGMHYFNFSGSDKLTRFIDSDRKNIRVLEVGCDCGATLLHIKNLFPEAYTVGCDISKSAVKLAERFVDNAFVANIEEYNLSIEAHSLDYVLFGDVLEHLRNPEQTLRYVQNLLKDNGKVLACIPNLMHISVVKDLLMGNFTYTEIGLLDKTHIHFFTFNEIVKMYSRAGYSIDECASYKRPISEEDDALIDKLIGLVPGAEKHMYQTFQYLVKAGMQ
ncbi:methyltransferase domain-containing protein [Butyrivibrio fibrisolvens]|uniref:methyltransferase domain-containing protein n=1 Tax=Butyrivibrio fibrisolvens TaxID=831 RepID=UPI0004143723|nr:methyltransferase domain-containing protein [Butyrivibrio fibrisolvens]